MSTPHVLRTMIPCIGSSPGIYQVMGFTLRRMRLSSAKIQDDEEVVLYFIMSDSLRLEKPSRGAI
jgi:hypothetical protein